MESYNYSQQNLAPPSRIARNLQCKSMPPWRSLLSLILLLMALMMPHQAWAGDKFSDYAGHVSHHPTLDEPWIEIDLWFYDTYGAHAFFLHDETESGHKGPALYINGNYICSPDWELAWPGSKKDGNEDDLSDQTKNNGWWGDTYTNSVNGVNYTVRFWNPHKDGSKYWVTMVIYLDKICHDGTQIIELKGKWKINDQTTNETQSGAWVTNFISGFFTDSPTYTRSYGSCKVTNTSLNSNYGPTTVTLTTNKSYFNNNYGWGYKYYDPKSINNSVYQEYEKGATNFDNLTITYDEPTEAKNHQLTIYTQKAITVTPANRPSTIVYGWRADNVGDFLKPTITGTTTNMWDKEIKLTWRASGQYSDGTWSIYRYEGKSTSGKLVAENLKTGDTEYSEYSDEVPKYDSLYRYEVYFVPTKADKLIERLKDTVSVKVDRDFNINIKEVVSGKNSITVKWNCPQFKGNENYSFKVLRAESKNGEEVDNWTEVASVSVTKKDQTEYEYIDSRNLEICPTYLYKVQTTMLENKTFESTNIGEGRLTGTSQVTKVTCTKGDYNGLVKLSWEADQVSSDITRYEVQRRVKGTETWAVIYKTSGTATSYYYEDQTALPGQYYDYKVVSITTCDGSDTRLAKTDEGFSRSTGIVSGRITYDTGTAVAGARVALMRGDSGEQQSGQFYSLRVSGTGDGVFLDNEGKKFNNIITNRDYSVQMMVRPDDKQSGSKPTIFDLGGKLSLWLGSIDAAKRFPLYIQVDSTAVDTKLYLQANEFTSVTLAVGRSGYAVITTIDKNDSVATCSLADRCPVNVKFADNDTTGLCIGGSYVSAKDSAFSGYIDEMRMFSGKALTEKEILSNYNHTLCGTEDNLVAYWPVDEGIDGQTTAYDYSKTSGVNNNHHGRLGAGTKPTSAILPTSNQLGLFALTDTQGNFVVRGVPFSGDGTNYMVVPTLGIHEFSPTYSTRYVSASSLVHSGVDFNDVSSFPVSGYVYYDGTDYPVEGCTFYVDGTICNRDGELIQTNDSGKFTISVPIGLHYIQVKKDGHVFASSGRYPEDRGFGDKTLFDREIKNMTFLDQTLVNFSGRVVGGSIEGDKPIGFGQSVNNIGVTEIVLSPTNTKYRMNVVKSEDETIFSYNTNKATVPIASATTAIASRSWRGAGQDACKNLYIRTDSLTGEFSAMIPPLMYKVEKLKVVANDLVVGDATTLDATNTLMEYTDSLVDSIGVKSEYKYNCSLKQTYHSTPSFSVTQDDLSGGAFGISSYEIEDANGKLTINDIYKKDTVGNDTIVTYKYGGAIFEREKDYTFNLYGYEEYVNNDVKNQPVVSRVPLDGSVVTINNALSSTQKVYIEGNTAGANPGSLVELESNQLTLDSNGKAKYTWKAGLPNITPPYSRTISINYDINERTYDWSGNGMSGIILGSLPTGNNFVTSGPDMVDMILRDPPGSKSFTEWTKGSVTSKYTSSGDVCTSESELLTSTQLGASMETVQGVVGFGLLNKVESKNALDIGVHQSIDHENANTWSSTITATRTISTSSEPEYVGANGDVFIGTSTNLIFGKARDINFRRQGTSDTVALELKDIITTGLKFKTMFSYTQHYVENVLLPNLRTMRNSLLQTVSSIKDYSNTSNKPVYLTTLSPDDPRFGSNNNDYDVWGNDTTSARSLSGPSYTVVLPPDSSYSDSVQWCNMQIRNWKKQLALNEKEKVEANKSRDKYIDQNYSFDSGSTICNSTKNEESNGSTYDLTITGAAVLGISLGSAINHVGVEWSFETKTGGGTHDVSKESETDLKSFSYTLAEDSYTDALTVDVYKYGNYSPIFRTLGGQTSGPYEGEVKTKYYQPGTTIMEATMQVEVPQIAVDVPTVTNVPTGSAASYTLRLTNASEIDTDIYYKLLMIDESNPNGAKITIDGSILTDNRIIKIPAGETVTKSLQLWQTNNSILNYDKIGIVLASQSQYDPTRTWQQIADTVYISAQFVPSSSAVAMKLDRTTLNSQTGDNLNISFSQFDRNYHNLKAFRIQYRKQGETGWTLVHEYVLDENDVTQNNELLPTDATVSYKLPMHNYSDGDYTFRVLSVSTYGNDEVYNTSEEIALVKDMARPQPLGTPSPTDGILSAGDDISIEFNENFLRGELTKNANFLVTGVLNGAEVSHSTALGMTGAANTAATAADINLAGKSFSIDTWVNVEGAGTLLSHGKGQQKFVVSVDDANKLNVKIGSNTYTSKDAIPMGLWSYLTISYTASAEGNTLAAAVAEGANTTQLFKGETVVAYEGNGPIVIGQNVAGAMHELTLWDEAYDMTGALLNKSKTKNPATRHLIGYWKMDEGEGTTITDYARNRHMSMANESWYINNENKAVELDGTSHLDIPTGDVSPLDADNCAIELWMRADKQQGESQLLQAGKVQLWMTDAGMLQLTSGDNTYDASSASVQDNAWHHVALNILRDGNAAVYVDGARTMATNAANIGLTASDKLIVGARRTLNENGQYDYDRQMVGFVDEIRLWNATLSADMLKSRSKLRLTGKEQGLVAYYPFEKKGLDNNQVVTTGSDDDAVRTDHKAVCGNALTFTDEAPALREKKTETNVDYSFTASDNKIVITINETPAKINACTLNFTVRDLSDTNGNLSLPVCWSAYIDNNALAWNESSLKTSTKVGESHTFEASFANKGGTQQMWTISGLPSWLKASAEYGTVDPLATETISFEVTETTPVGKYEETIYLTDNDGITTPFTLQLIVEGDKPAWAVDKRKYENTMSVIGTLSILGTPSYDSDDIVGAFIGDECRGVAQPVYNSRYDNCFVLIDLYGDSKDADKAVTFKVYDASTGIMHPITTTSEEVTFKANVLVGKYSNPLLIDAADKMEQTLALGTGWNWASLYVKTDNMDVETVLSNVSDATKIVKSQNSFAGCDEGTWYGKTFDLDNKSMYKIKMAKDKELNVIGKYGSKADRTITVTPGWNWIAYNNPQTASVADALAGMNPQDGDMIKGQSGFAIYDGYEWAGSLTALVPGQGYMLKSESSETRTFNYPASTLTTLTSVQAAPSKRFTTLSDDELVFSPIDYHKYPNNMTITACVTLEGEIQQGVEVGVFVGDECRTSEITGDDGYAFFTVPGDGKCELNFKMAKGDQTWTSEVIIDFIEDSICGSYRNPLELIFGRTSDMISSIDDINAEDNSGQWLDLNGIMLDGKPNVPGVYLLRTTEDNTGRTVTRKVVVK